MSDMIRLWTIQPLVFFETFEKSGVMRADGRRADRDFKAAYQFMMRQMNLRLKRYAGRFPIWAWQMPKPDLRKSCHAETGTQQVRIECVVPRDRVLLSEFSSWHSVLSNNFLALTEGEWDSYIRRKGVGVTSQEHNKLELEKVRSWNRVFDIPLIREHSGTDWSGELTHVQACLEEIYWEEVTNVTHFVSR